MKKDVIELGFMQKNDGEEKAKRIFDAFTFYEPTSLNEIQAEADEAFIVETYNAQRRVKAQNGGLRAAYVEYKQGKLGLEELKKMCENWKPGFSYSSDSMKAEKIVNSVAASPALLMAVLEKLGVTEEQFKAMQSASKK